MKKPDFNAAMAATIERDDIVVQVAKIIDPGAFQVWWNGTGEDAKKIEPDTRVRYAQSTAIAKAAQILKLAAAQKKLKKQLADSEAADWELLGIPANDPDLRKIIDRKHGLSKAASPLEHLESP